MNPPPTAKTPGNAGLDWECAFPVALAVLIGVAAITTQGFWMDEASVGTIAGQSTLANWWQAMKADNGSTAQMPLYLLYAWSWEKIFGHNEWWLRLSNLPWLALGLLAIPRRQTAFLLLMVFSPFVWFYLNEFRPYVMQIGISLLLLGALWRLAGTSSAPDQSGRGEGILTGLFCFGLVALSGSSLLGVIWVGAAGAAAMLVLGWPRVLRLARQNALTLVITSLVLIALAGYYLWSLERGNRATPGATGIGNTLFAFYELFGFAGLGPGRTQIREIGFSSIPPFVIPLALQGVVTAFVFFAGCKHVVQQTPRRVWLGGAASLGAAVILLLAVGVLKHFRVLGRHFAPLAPALILLLAVGLRSLWSRAGWRRWLAVFFVLFSIASSISLRFAGRHAKDDYRTAAAIAIAANANNEKVWWCADASTGLYYRVPLSPRESLAAPGRVWLASHPSVQLLANQPPPDLLILSKPDLYDENGLMRPYLENHHYIMFETLPAFSLWRKKTD
jgi:hypothetical protein